MWCCRAQPLSRLLITVFLFFCALPLPVCSSESAPGLTMCRNLTFEEISLHEGLSQSIVECMIQDRYGFLWLGTEDGINIYDGYRFQVIRQRQGDANSLSYNHVKAMLEDRNGFIWIGTFHGGLNRYDPVKRQFKRYRHDPAVSGSLPHDAVCAIVEDNLGTLWIGTAGGLCRYHPSVDQFEWIGTAGSDEPYSVNALALDGDDRIWAGTDSGLYRLTEDRKRLVIVSNVCPEPVSGYLEVRGLFMDRGDGSLWIAAGADGLFRGTVPDISFESLRLDSSVRANVRTVFVDSDGIVWVGTDGQGLFRLDPDSRAVSRFVRDPLKPHSISYNEITSILEDRSGLLWVGTYGGGVNRVRRNSPFLHYLSVPGDRNTISHEIVWTFCEDAEGNLWVGTHGGGLDMINRKTGNVSHFRHDPADEGSLSNNIVRKLLYDSRGRLWAGTHGGGLNLMEPGSDSFRHFRHDPDNPRSLSHDELRDIYEDSRGRIWVGTYGGGLCLYHPESGDFTVFRQDPGNPESISYDIVRCILEAENGDLWVGTQGGGLNRFNPETGVFHRYRHDADRVGSLCNDSVFSLHRDRQGVLWIGTWGSGLCYYMPETDTFASFTQSDGLPNNSIYGILEDEAGHLWLSTNHGISRFDPESLTFHNYDVRDGLQSNEFNGNAYFKSSWGEMFFGGINGFNAFFPEDVTDNPHVPPVVLTGVSVLNEPLRLDTPVHLLDHLRLSWKDSVFEFTFSALDFRVPGKNRYQYRMIGVNDNWVSTTADKRYATYTTLEPGEYVFQVRGSNNDGIWNETGISIPVVIAPPWWKTLWFKLGVGLAVLLIGAVFYRMQMRNVRLATEWQAARKAQMSIMPQSDPEIEGGEISGICLPAHEVGGDFFDYFQCEGRPGRLGLAVGDVSGKSMDSAMVAVMSSGMVCAQLQNDISMGDVLTRLNRPIFRKTDRRMFTALCLAVVDTDRGRIAFANAGLHDILYKSGNHIQPLRGSGPRLPLGVLGDTVYQEEKRTLKTGDVLVFFTDGIPEALNRNREFYGPTRLARLIHRLNTDDMTAAEIRDAIVRDVRSFSNSCPQHDDITAVVFKYRGNGRVTTA